MKKILLLTTFSILFLSISFSQSKREMKRIYKHAESLLTENKFDEAKPLFQKLYDSDKNNDEYIFFLGISEFGTSNEDKAIDLFNKIITKYVVNKEVSSFTLPSYYYTGKSYHYLYMFDVAIDSYTKMKEFDLDEDGLEIVNEAIANAKEGKLLFEAFQPMMVTRLAVLNSKYDDHTPIPTADAMKIFFTSKRKGGVSGDTKSPEGRMYEDIWVWDKSKGLMSKPYNIGVPVNTVEHDATCGLSHDGKTLFIYKSTKKNAGDIFYSKLTDGKWSEPKKLNKNINRKRSVEKHAALSADGKKLYFSSDRKRGINKTKGGRDIWCSEIQEDSTWGKPYSVSFNTKYDEESPFILPDGKTMYFSSMGYNGLGGYDIFRVVMDDDGNWGKPMNIGFPINTARDDVYYFPLSNEKIAYFTRIENNVANIYKANLFADDEVLIVQGIVEDNNYYSENYPLDRDANDTLFYDNRYSWKKRPTMANEDSVTVVSVTDGNKITEDIYFVPDSETIKVFDLKQKRFTDNTYPTASKEGDYKIVIMKDKDLKMVYESPEHLYDTKNVEAGKKYKDNLVNYNAVLVKIEEGKTKKVKLVNFAEGSSDFNIFTSREFDLIEEYIKKYPQLYVNFSTEDYLNKPTDIASTRKQAAVDYFKSVGIPEDHIYVDLSPSNINPNDMEYTIYDKTTLDEAIKEKEDRTPKDTVIVADTDVVTLEITNVYFDFNRYRVRVASNEDLNKLATFMVNDKSVVVKITGYTDGVGSDTYNKKLSLRRANAVKDYLISKGVSADQLEVRGFGEENPITMNKKNGAWYEESKQYNRRVELSVTNQGKVSLKIVQFKNIPAEFKNSDYILDYRGR